MNRLRSASCAAALFALASSFGANAEDPTCDKNHYILTGAVPGDWTATGGLNVPRSFHSATLLADGKVLVAGGRSVADQDVLDSAELYDPSTGRWSVTGSLIYPRSGHTATLLPDGKVLVAGGDPGTASAGAVELYDPATGAWTPTGSLNTPRTASTATLLATSQVLIAGGIDDSNEALGSAELYDPSTGTWSLTGNLIAKRFWHTATPLEDGRVLVAGGVFDNWGTFGDFSPWMTLEAELYDPISGTWSSTAPLYWFRALHTATRLPDGKVLVAGGYRDGIMDPISLAETVIFDPASATWTTAADMNQMREGHTATLLPDGEVLVVGGFDWSVGVEAKDAELYETATSTWADGGALSLGRVGHTATLLPNATVLVAGGEQGLYGMTTPGSAVVYGRPATDGCR